MHDQRQGLGIMDDNQVVIITVEVVAPGALENDRFVDVPFQRGEIEGHPLKRIVHPLGDSEEIRRTLQRAPAGRNPQFVQEQGKR